MDLLKLIAETLLEYETITKEQIDYLVEHGCMPDEEEIDKEEEIKLEDLSKEELIEKAKKKKLEISDDMTREELIDLLKEN